MAGATYAKPGSQKPMPLPVLTVSVIVLLYVLVGVPVLLRSRDWQDGQELARTPPT